MIDLFNLFMGDYYEKNKSYMWGLIVISLLFIISESILAPYFISNILNNLKNYEKYLLYAFILYVIIFVLFYFKKKYEKDIFADLITKPREQLFSGIIDKYSENYKSLKMGTTTAKINNITIEFRNCFYNLIIDILPNICVLFLISCVLFYFNTNIGLLLFLCSILFIIFILIYKKDIFKLKDQAENYYYKINDNLIDIYESLMNTYLTNSEREEKEKIVNDQKMHNYFMVEKNKVENDLSYVLYSIIIITLFICLLLVLKSNESINKKTIIVLFLIYFINSAVIITKNIPLVLQLYGSIVYNIHFVESLLNENIYKKVSDLNNGNIQFKNVYFSYNNNDDPILKNVNLNVVSGTKLAIMGRSGSGKSTLSKLLLKFYPYKGNILIDNQELKNINTNYLRSKILYCNQKTMLYDKTVIENIKYGNNATDDEILEILKNYELLELFNGLKNGIYSDAGVQGNELSHGMQKIVILLRTILKVMDALIIIFDEPLAGLDENTRKKVIKLINDYCKNKTLIIITHDKEILPHVDKVIDLSKINKRKLK
jgi:ABC-type multidrug transport system fused ATPase/permease subunit